MHFCPFIAHLHLLPDVNLFRVEHLSVCVPAVPSYVAMYHKLRRHPVPMRTIVDDVSCEVRPGQLMAILGPSGSGKTSFLDAVALR